MFDLCVIGKMDKVLDMSDLDLLSVMYSAMIHDFKHPGFNNGFMINTQSEIALMYNDKSVLENFHISESFKLLKKYNIFEKLNAADFKILRKRTVEMVLSTDMVNHGKLVGVMNSRLCNLNEEKEFSLKKYMDENPSVNKFDIQQDFFNFVLHAVDIGHAAKPFELELKWAEMVTDEFLNQGDTEKAKNIPISFLCDRNTSNLPASQVGFIAGLVIPTFELVNKLLPNSILYTDLIVHCKNEWVKLKESDIKAKEEKELKDLKEKENTNNINNLNKDN